MKYKEKTFMGIAKIMAENSTCMKHKVGAVIVKGERVISTGYNGVPSGMVECSEVRPENHHQFAIEREIHAEQNAICYAARYGISVEGGEMYTTLSPCYACAKSIIASGIRRVVYLERYKEDGIGLLEEAGITVEGI